MLLYCGRAALIRIERVARAFALGDERATAALAFDTDQRRQCACLCQRVESNFSLFRSVARACQWNRVLIVVVPCPLVFGSV